MNPAEFANIARAEQKFWWYRGQRKILHGLLAPLLPDRPIRHVLEAGCGTGYQALCFAQQYGWAVTALDLGWQGLMHGRELGVPRLVQGDLATLPFASASFDAVASLDVIVHFPRGQEWRAFEELARVLKPGGLFIVRVSALDALRSLHSEFAGERQRFTRRRLSDQASLAGIRVLRLTYANCLLLPVALAKFRLWEPLSRQAPASGVQPVSGWLDSLLHSALRAEAWLTGRGIDLPVGQSLVLIGEKPV